MGSLQASVHHGPRPWHPLFFRLSLNDFSAYEPPPEDPVQAWCEHLGPAMFEPCSSCTTALTNLSNYFNIAVYLSDITLLNYNSCVSPQEDGG